jgi:hypothetical protein
MGSSPIAAANAAPIASPAVSSPRRPIPAAPIANTESSSPNLNKVVEGLKDLKIGPKPSLIVNGTGSTSTERSSKAGNSQTPSDETSQKGDSSSELGMKPASIDGKSITSGTTFNALDEKESLRPDDSASVKAAAEDDDAFSMRGPYISSSRIGSEVAARVHRIQIGDMPPRNIPISLPEPHVQGTAAPPAGPSEQPPVPDARMPLAAASSAAENMNQLYRQAPDEKLLEAMRSPKDRLFLLRLEKDVIDFVQDSK